MINFKKIMQIMVDSWILRGLKKNIKEIIIKIDFNSRFIIFI